MTLYDTQNESLISVFNYLLILGMKMISSKVVDIVHVTQKSSQGNANV